MAKKTKLYHIRIKELTNYWFRLVFPRALREIWEYIREHVAMASLILLAAITTSFLSANGILDTAIANGFISDANNWIRTLVALLILSMLYLLFSIFYYPTLLHQELEDDKKRTKEKYNKEIKNLKTQNQGLKEELERKELEANIEIEEFLQDDSREL